MVNRSGTRSDLSDQPFRSPPPRASEGRRVSPSTPDRPGPRRLAARAPGPGSKEPRSDVLRGSGVSATGMPFERERPARFYLTPCAGAGFPTARTRPEE
jgi:hypothetical protein